MIICSDGKGLPWESSMRQVLKFFIKCKENYKPIFATGIGMAMLVYNCAIGYKIINVDGKEGDIDEVTGDYYVYEKVL